uniref:PRA1 family protein n=1 Tax=Blastobotrys adeninivorans TaxID=409370 RepID=A0A060T246_BLAAD
MNSITSRIAQLPLLNSDNGISLDNIRNAPGSIRGRLANFRSLGDFFDYKRFSKPAGVGEAQSRINFNLGYFSTNYAIIFLLLSIYSLVTNLRLLFLVVFVVLGMTGISYLGGEDLNLGFTRVTSSSLYTYLIVVALILGIFASPLSTLLWLIGASGVCILGHAAFMDKPIESAFAEQV